jgi:hypothetical protein
MGVLISTKYTEDHVNNTRHNIDLHLPFSRLLTYQNVTIYMSIRLFNSITFRIKAPLMINSSEESKLFFIFIHSNHYRNILT